MGFTCSVFIYVYVFIFIYVCRRHVTYRDGGVTRHIFVTNTQPFPIFGGSRSRKLSCPFDSFQFLMLRKIDDIDRTALKHFNHSVFHEQGDSHFDCLFLNIELIGEIIQGVWQTVCDFNSPGTG